MSPATSKGRALFDQIFTQFGHRCGFAAPCNPTAITTVGVWMQAHLLSEPPIKSVISS
jgi:hypothetical protein